MENKKFDPWQFVGFFLIALILTWMLNNQQPIEEVAPDNTKQTEASTNPVTEGYLGIGLNDSLQDQQMKAAYGSFSNLFQVNKSVDLALENEKLSWTKLLLIPSLEKVFLFQIS